MGFQMDVYIQCCVFVHFCSDQNAVLFFFKIRIDSMHVERMIGNN